MQIEMTQTFNMNILNNSMAAQALKSRANRTTQGASMEDLGAATDLRGIRTVRSEANDAFSVIPGAKI